MRGQRWRVGLVGCGRIAGAMDTPQRGGGPVRTHAQAYTQHPRVDLCAVAHPGHAARQAFQARWGVPAGYDSLDAMLAHERLDVVSLCSPTSAHAAQAVHVLRSAARPRVLFIEKPLCQTREELEELLALARESGVACLVNHTRRFDASYRWVAQVIQSGELGPLIEGRWTTYGGWMNNGTHLVDTLSLLFGRRPQVISATIAESGRGDDRDLHAMFRVDEAMVRIESVDETHYQLFEAELRFAQGRVQLTEGGSTIIVERVRVNRERERILVPDDRSPIAALNTALASAVAAIDGFLQGRHSFRELGVDVESASLTMDIMWETQALALREGQTEPLRTVANR